MTPSASMPFRLSRDLVKSDLFGGNGNGLGLL